MKPTKNKLFKEKVSQITKQSGLDSKEQEEIAKELYSHLCDKYQDQLVQGKSEAQASKIACDKLGQSQKLGRQFREVYRPLEGIPVIGPVFYYQPLRYGFWLFCLTLSAIFSFLPVVWIMSLLPYDPSPIVNDFNQNIVGVLYLLGGLLPFVFPLLQGILVYKKIATGKRLESVIISYVPLVLIILNLLLRELLANFSYPIRFEWSNVSYLILGVIYLAMHILILVAGFSVAKVLSRISIFKIFKSKYEEVK